MNEKDNIKRHYELTDNTIVVDGQVLHQIICTESFSFAIKGDLGGFIEGYQNLEGNGWVCNNAKVKEVLLSFRRSLQNVGGECSGSSMGTFDYV